MMIFNDRIHFMVVFNGFQLVMGVPQARWMVYSGKSDENMDDLGVPPFQETSI